MTDVQKPFRRVYSVLRDEIIEVEIDENGKLVLPTDWSEFDAFFCVDREAPAA